MAGVFMRFASGRAGASGDHARYITRPPATERDMDAVLTRNYPDEVRDAGDYGELRDQLEEYCRQQEDGELARPFRGGHGETRTHYRLVLSFEEHVDTREARELADDYLERTFPDARALAAVHQDTEHTHVHVHLQARDSDDRKLHFDRHSYQRLDEQWAEVYAREYGPEKLEQHRERKAATRDWRREVAAAREAGREPPERPERAGRGWQQEDRQRWEERHYGHDQQSRTGGDQRGVAGRDADAAGGERALGDDTGASDRADTTARRVADEFDRASRAADQAVRTADRLVGRVRGPDRGDGERNGRTAVSWPTRGPDRDDDDRGR